MSDPIRFFHTFLGYTFIVEIYLDRNELIAMIVGDPDIQTIQIFDDDGRCRFRKTVILIRQPIPYSYQRSPDGVREKYLGDYRYYIPVHYSPSHDITEHSLSAQAVESILHKYIIKRCRSIATNMKKKNHPTSPNIMIGMQGVVNFDRKIYFGRVVYLSNLFFGLLNYADKHEYRFEITTVFTESKEKF